MSKKKVFISAYISEDIKRAVEKQAQIEHRTVSGMVRIALDMYLKAVQPKGG
ncbi:MAG: hypothetical protein QF704_00460 [Anaerolineales bacterium]|nr:hypothetical protein [Anaerolineales bacterium]